MEKSLMLSSKQIIDNLLTRRSAQRMGIYELIWPDTSRQWISQDYPADPEGNAMDACEHFGFDMDMVGDWWDIMPIRGYEEIVQETDQWHIKRNGAGASLKYWKNKSGTPEHVDFKMTSRQVWEKDYRSHLLTLDPARINIDLVRERLTKRHQQRIWAFYGHMFIFECLRQSMGDLCLYESVLLDKDWIHDYNRVYTDFFKTHYQYIFEKAGLPDGIWLYEDLGYKNKMFCSPAIYEELFFPYYQELVNFFKGYGLPVVLHSCGFIEQLVPSFIEIGFDALNPMEVKAGCDPVRLAQTYGDKIAFIGGLNVSVLESGDRNIVKNEIVKLVKSMKNAGAAYIFATDHSVSTSVSYADYKFAVEVFKENCFY